jgi:hypothetical protein
VPRAGRDEVGGERQGALLVRLTAPPAENRANDALRKLLAERLRIPRRGVESSAVSGRERRSCGLPVSPRRRSSSASADRKTCRVAKSATYGDAFDHSTRQLNA